jgi:mannosidase alpha-like ER degradation enhancer 1
MGNQSEFKRAVNWIARNINFDYDLNVSVFETNIRVLGSLLSAHLLIKMNDKEIIDFPEYKDELLHLANDLGRQVDLALFSNVELKFPLLGDFCRHLKLQLEFHTER